MKDNLGYSVNMIRLLIGQCAQAWNLQSSPPLKSRGVGGNSGLQAKPFYFPKDSSAKLLKHQATSIKPQAASVKLKATSNKLLDPGPFVKFHAPRTEGLYYDKTILWMFNMKRNLVW